MTSTSSSWYSTSAFSYLPRWELSRYNGADDVAQGGNVGVGEQGSAKDRATDSAAAGKERRPAVLRNFDISYIGVCVPQIWIYCIAHRSDGALGEVALGVPAVFGPFGDDGRRNDAGAEGVRAESPAPRVALGRCAGACQRRFGGAAAPSITLSFDLLCGRRRARGRGRRVALSAMGALFFASLGAKESSPVCSSPWR